MNVKTLTTSVATAAFVGVLGLAYAQSSSDSAAPATDNSMHRPAQAAPTPPATTPSTPSTAPQGADTTSTPSSTSTTSPPSDGATTDAAPRADRG